MCFIYYFASKPTQKNVKLLVHKKLLAGQVNIELLAHLGRPVKKILQNLGVFQSICYMLLLGQEHSVIIFSRVLQTEPVCVHITGPSFLNRGYIILLYDMSNEHEKSFTSTTSLTI